MTPPPEISVAKLSFLDGKETSFPYLKGTLGPSVVDVEKLYQTTGVFSFDPGFSSSAERTPSKITQLDIRHLPLSTMILGGATAL